MKITCMIVLTALCWNQGLQRKVSREAREAQYGPASDEVSWNEVSNDSPPARPKGKDAHSVNAVDAPELTEHPETTSWGPRKSENLGDGWEQSKLTNDPNKEHTHDPNEDNTNDPTKDHTNYPNENGTNDPNKDRINDANNDNTNDPNKDHTNDPNKERTSDPNKDRTNDPNKEHTNDPNEDHTNDPNKDHTYDPNENRTNNPNKDLTNDPNNDNTNDPNEHTNDPNEDRTSDPNKDHTNDPNKEHTNDPNEDRTNDPNKEHTNDPNKDRTNDPNKEHTNDPNEDRTNDPNKEHTNDPNEDHTNDPNEDRTNYPNQEHANDPNKEHYDRNVGAKFDQKGEPELKGSATHMLKEPEEMMHGLDHDGRQNEKEQKKGESTKETDNKQENDEEGGKEQRLEQFPPKNKGLEEQAEGERKVNERNKENQEETDHMNDISQEMSDEKLFRSENEANHDDEEARKDGESLYFFEDRSEEFVSELISGKRDTDSDFKARWAMGTNDKEKALERVKKQDEIHEGADGTTRVRRSIMKSKEILARTPGEVREDYIGCYVDNRDDRDLKCISKSWGIDNSPNKCINECYYKGYKYAGLQFAQECWCENSYGKYGSAPEDRCSKQCPGSKEDKCGGDLLNSVYRTGIQDYIGCYADKSKTSMDEHDLNGEYLKFASDNSPDRCIGYCKKAGWKYAALQFSWDCYCGNSYGRYGNISSTRCQEQRCPNHSQIFCGGDSANAVYSTGHRGDNYIGCYVDVSEDRDTGELHFHTTRWTTENSPSKCIEACLKNETMYAGLQFGRECWCGNSYGKHGRAKEAKCNQNCRGFDKTVCGGSEANSFYVTGYGRDRGDGLEAPPGLSTNIHNIAKDKTVLDNYKPLDTGRGRTVTDGNTVTTCFVQTKTDGANVYWIAVNLGVHSKVFSYTIFPFGITAQRLFYSVVSSKAELGIFPPPKKVRCQYQKDALPMATNKTVDCEQFRVGKYFSLIRRSSEGGFRLCELAVNGYRQFVLNHGAACDENSETAVCLTGSTCQNKKCRIMPLYPCNTDADCVSDGQCEKKNKNNKNENGKICKAVNMKCNVLNVQCLSSQDCVNWLCILEGRCIKTEDCVAGLACDFLLRQCKQAYDEECTNDDMCLSNSVCDDGKCKYGLMALCDGNPDSCATGLSCDLKEIPNLCKVELNSPCDPEECTSDAVCDFHISQCRVAIKYECSDKVRLCATATYCDPRNKCGNGVGDRCTHEGKDDPCVAGAVCTIMDECRCNAKVAKRKGKICEPKPGKYRGSCNETQPCDKNMACVDKVCDCSLGYNSTQLFGCKEEMSASTSGGDEGQVVLATVLGTVFGVALVAVLAGVGYMQRKRSQQAKRNPVSPGQANRMSPGPANPGLPGPSNPVSPGQANPK